MHRAANSRWQSASGLFTVSLNRLYCAVTKQVVQFKGVRDASGNHQGVLAAASESPVFSSELLAGHEPGVTNPCPTWDKDLHGKGSLLGHSATHRDHEPGDWSVDLRSGALRFRVRRITPGRRPALVEAGIMPASEGGILPPGWKPGLTGSQGWLPPRFL